MYNPNPERTPETPDERWSSAIFLLLFVGLILAGLLQDFEPVKISAVLVVLFWVPLLALHEAGHALMAAAVGWHVGQVVIGMGNEIKRFRVGGTPVEIRMFPVSGFVRHVPTNLNLPHLKCALIYFAGPGIELLLAGVLLLAVGPDRLLTRTNDYLIIAVQSLALAATAVSTVAWPVRMITSVSRLRSLSCCRSSSPDMPGMFISTTATSKYRASH